MHTITQAPVQPTGHKESARPGGSPVHGSPLPTYGPERGPPKSMLLWDDQRDGNRMQDSCKGYGNCGSSLIKSFNSDEHDRCSRNPRDTDPQDSSSDMAGNREGHRTGGGVGNHPAIQTSSAVSWLSLRLWAAKILLGSLIATLPHR
jgi:hypothetical protein